MTNAGAPHTVVMEWVRQNVREFPLDGRDVLAVLPAHTSRADVVGLAAGVRTAHELVTAGHATLRALVSGAGFRAASIEGTDDTAAGLDHYVTDGVGEPEPLVAGSQGFLRNRETLELIRWLRAHNIDHSDDPVRVVHEASSAAPGPSEVEAALTGRVLRWRESTGHRIVHLGGTSHAVVGDPRTVSPYTTDGQRNAGANLRAELGHGYQSFGLTMGRGDAQFPLPSPPEHFTEAVFDDTNHRAVLLDLHADPHPPDEVARWLQAPLRTRFVGPAYDVRRDAEHHVAAGPLVTAVDALVHVRRITQTTPLVP